MKKLYLLLFILCFNMKANNFQFNALFKPIELTYLYDLYNTHEDKQAELDDMFKIVKKINLKNDTEKKVISYSLFWKAVALTRKQPIVTEQTLYEKNIGVKEEKSFFEVYVQPLLTQLKNYKNFFPGWTARVYLANDLQFLLPKLQDLLRAPVSERTTSSLPLSPEVISM